MAGEIGIKAFLRKNAAVIVAIVVTVAVWAVTSAVYSNAVNERMKAQETLDGVQAEVQVVEDSNKAKHRVETAEAQGVSLDRIDKDASRFEAVLRDMCSWNSYDEYMAVRDKMISEYGIAEDSWVMTKFMPEVVDDERYGNTIDNHQYNMSFEECDVRCVSVNGDVYSYFVQAWVSSGISDSRATSMCAFTFDTKPDGSLVNVDGTAVEG